MVRRGADVLISADCQAVFPSQRDLKGELSCPLLLKHPSRNARSCLLDRTASLVQVSLTPSPRIQNGGSPQLRADPRLPTGRRPHPLISTLISWTARARQTPFHLSIT